VSGDFDHEEFYRFSKALRIDSKERGIITLGDNLLGTQHRLIEQMTIGFQQGVREFVTLKCRQIGVSTLSMAFDLYWLNKYKGINGALVVHEDGAREQFRTTLNLYFDGLPDEWKREVLSHNRSQLVLDHGSRLQYRVAGATEKKNSTLGRSGALAFCHATECAFWGDPKGIGSLRSSFAEHNPIRFYHWETTANGRNHFYDLWQDAKKSVSVKPIFISFWSNELYRCPRGTELYTTYWGHKGRMTEDERDWVREVKLMYDFDVDAEQIAWYRYMAAEKITDEDLLAQEFPPTEERAFIATGSAFFRAIAITRAMKQCEAAGPPGYYRIEVGSEFRQTKIIEAKPKQATLKVWQEPVAGATYVLGCDPNWSSSEDSDRNCISVWRAWYNRVEQVAEFCTTEISTYATAWIMAYMGGYFSPCSTNIEINGPGAQVLAELINLKRAASSKFEGDAPGSMRQVVQHIRQYVYRRVDSTGGSTTSLHTKTSYDIKERMMNGLRDCFERGILVVRSAELVEEMKFITREPGSAPAAESGKHDDRVMAAGLALMCWNDQLRLQLMNQRQFYIEDDSTQLARKPTPGEALISKYLTRIGVAVDPRAPPPKKTMAKPLPSWARTVKRAEKVTF
jgi:hypothetical protein